MRFGVPKFPDGMSVLVVTHFQRSSEAGEPRNARLQPFDESLAGRDNGHVQTFVDIVLVLRNVIAIGIHEDRTVAIDTPAKEVGEILVRNPIAGRE